MSVCNQQHIDGVSSDVSGRLIPTFDHCISLTVPAGVNK